MRLWNMNNYNAVYNNQPTPTAPGAYVTPGIVRCPDGKYRWMYELPMFSNSTILLTVIKVVAITFGILFGMFLVIDLISGNMDAFVGSLPVLLILFGVFLGIAFISYIILALCYGGKYIVLFEMDERGVDHIQAPRQYKKAHAIKLLGALASVSSPNIPAGAGIASLIGTNNVQRSTFSKVKSVRFDRRKHVIYVDEALIKNQVYAADCDYDFVVNFIMSHCNFGPPGRGQRSIF